MNERKAARELLARWASTGAYCAERELDIDTLGALIDGLYADYPASDPSSGIPHSKNPGDPTGRLAASLGDVHARYVDSVCRLRELIADRLVLYNAIDALIVSLPDRQRAVLDLRYRRGKSWEYIANHLHMSGRSVQRLETLAVSKLAQQIRCTGYLSS